MNLPAQIDEVLRVFGGERVFLPDAGVWGVEVRHRGRSVVVCPPPDYPLSASLVFIDPEPVHAHYYRHAGESIARLCWSTPWQHDPTFHLIVAVGSAIRFINEEL